jgi:TRAP-type C4-dicarboxylate transport system substrate-binding protein
MPDRRQTCALLAAMAALPARAQAAPWRLATGYRADSFHGQNLAQFARELAAAGGPAIALHANNALVKLAEIPAAVRAGRVEAGEAIMTGMAAEWPLAGADSLPFMVRSYADARRLWLHQRPLIEAALAPAGLHVLMAVPWPPQGLYSRKPVERVADLAGARMRTYNRTTERIAQMVGATPVDVPMVQVGQALAEGRVDCMITSAVTGVENEVWRQVNHYYEINAWFPKNLSFAAVLAVAALAPPAREALERTAAVAEQRGWAASERAADDALAALRQRGMKVERPTATLLADIKRLGERFSIDWVREVGTPANRLLIPYYAQQ